jgi:uncharacterized OB-fold protein
MRRLICWLFGHRSICLKRDMIQSGDRHYTLTGWKCERCGHTFAEQWDG